MRKALIAVLAVSMLVFAAAAMAGKTGTAVPWKYDPGHTGTVVANWSKEGLSLQKNTATTTNAAAGADIKGTDGELTSLSFEVKNGAYCGAGAPRFNVKTTAGTTFLGCSYGAKTDLANGWSSVVFDADEIAAAGTVGAIIDANIVMDEQGQTLLRNISVNGQPITR